MYSGKTTNIQCLSLSPTNVVLFLPQTRKLLLNYCQLCQLYSCPLHSFFKGLHQKIIWKKKVYIYIYFFFLLPFMLLNHIVNQWKRFLTVVYLTSAYLLPYSYACRHTRPLTHPFPNLCSVGHQEADEGELGQKRGQGWRCEAGMSDWKGYNHWNNLTNCGIFSRISW